MRLTIAFVTFAACGRHEAAPEKPKVPPHLYAPDDNDGLLELVATNVGAVNALAGCEWMGIGTPGVKVRTDDAFLHTMDVPNGTNCVGYYDGAGTITLRTKEYSGWGRPQTLLHEMGHSVGLAHEKGTIMDPGIGNYPYDEAVASLIATAQEHGVFHCP